MRLIIAALLAGGLASLTPTYAAQVESVVIAQAKTQLVDINSAKAEELVRLKGIKEARAAAIVKGRPYARKDDLVRKKIVPQQVYDEIKDQIVAKQ